MPDDPNNGSNNTNGSSQLNVGASIRGVGDVLVGDAIIKLGFGYLNDVTEHYYQALTQQIKIQEAALTRQNQMYMASIEQATAIMQNNLDITISGFSKTANEIATQSLKLRVSEAKANIKAEKDKFLAEKDYLVKRQNVQGEMVKSFSTMTTNYASNMYGVYKGLMEVGGNVTDAVKKIAHEDGNGLGQLIAGIGGALAGFGKYLADIGTESVKLTDSAIQKQVSYSIQTLEYEKTKAELISRHIESVINSASDVLDKYITLYETMQDWVAKADTASHVQAAQMGWGGRGNTYTSHMINVTRDIAETFGKTTEELVAMQKTYIDESSRNVNFSQSDYGAMLGIGRGFGLSDSETAQMLGTMNVFNTSIAHSDTMMTNMYKSVTKMGLSASKFGKGLINNLQKAQKYNFKGGLENMMKITQWAQQTRFNLDAATGFSDRLLDGTISDALEASAKLQVLGGAAAMYSDPIAMLYEAGADIGSLAKRQAAMFNDLQGTFNAKTGETDFSWYENYMIKQRAQAAGISEEDAKNMIRQRHKQKVIDKELRGSKLTEEERVAVSNAALYDAKEGKWKVTDIKGDTYTLDELKGRDSAEILKNLMPKNKEDAMVKIAQQSLGYAEKQTNIQTWIAAALGANDYGEIVRVAKLNLDEEKRFYTNNFTKLTQMTGNIRTNSSEALKKQYRSDENNMPHIISLIDMFYQFMEETAKGKSNETEIKEMQEALKEMSDAYKNGSNPYELFYKKMFGNMYTPKMKDYVYTREQLMNLQGRDEKGNEEPKLQWYDDNFKPVIEHFENIIVPWFKNNHDEVRATGASVTTYTGENATKVITHPLIAEIKDLLFGGVLKDLGEFIFHGGVDDTLNSSVSRRERRRERLKNLWESIMNRGGGGGSGNTQNSGGGGGATAQNNIPVQPIQQTIANPQQQDYGNYAAITQTPPTTNNTSTQQTQETIHVQQIPAIQTYAEVVRTREPVIETLVQPTSDTQQLPIQYPVQTGDDVVEAIVTPFSDSMNGMMGAIQKLNDTLSNIQPGKAQLTISNDVNISGGRITVEDVKQAVLAAFTDSTFTSKLTKRLAVVSSDSYQFNGRSPMA